MSQQFELLKKSAVDQIASDLDQRTANRLQSWENTRNYDTAYSFEDGFTIGVDERQKVALFDDEWYRWDGAIPKTVPAGSAPQDEGGIGSGAWLSVGDAALRSDLSDGSLDNGKGALLARGAVIYVNTLSELHTLDRGKMVEGQAAIVQGSEFRWDSEQSTFKPIGYVNFLAFGGSAKEELDCTQAIQDALDTFGSVVIPTGANCRCDGMIEVKEGQSLYLQAGATLVRKAEHSSSTDPVVWVKGSRASCFGDSRRTCAIISRNRTPRGVLRLGHKDMTESHSNVTYSQVYNLSLIGADTGGRTDQGEPDVCLYMPNPQFNSLASYFHSIDKIYMQNANIGIWLLGWANANVIGDIQGFRLGNTLHGGPEDRAFIRFSGALDNVIQGGFFHQSPDSIGLIYEEWDNTANGGVLHLPTDSSFSGLIFEQGGASARGIYATTTAGRCFFQFIDNVAGGNAIPAGFTKNHMIFSRYTNNNSLRTSASVQPTRVTTDQTDTVNVCLEKGFNFTGLEENSAYDIGVISLQQSFSTALVEVHLSYRTGVGVQGGVHKLVGVIRRIEQGSVYDFTPLEYHKFGTGSICEFQNGARTIVFKTFNLGGDGDTSAINGFVRITGLNVGLTINESSTKSASSGVPLDAT